MEASSASGVEATPTTGKAAYEKIRSLGEGKYGIVNKCRHIASGDMFAIKDSKATGKDEDVPRDIIREIKAMRELDHRNVCKLMDVYMHDGKISLVLQLCPYDLEKLINEKQHKFTASHIKECLHQMLCGMVYIHERWMLHRDLKPANILIDTQFDLKLGDFGLARGFGSPSYGMSPEAITQWYRPPEMLFGARHYGSAVDMWSLGCIFAEMLNRRPYMPTKPHPLGKEPESDDGQLRAIFTALGTPTEEEWADMPCLPRYRMEMSRPPPPLKNEFVGIGEDALDLLSRMVKFNPSVRIGAKQALEHPYFTSNPPRSPKHELPVPASVFATEERGTKRSREES